MGSGTAVAERAVAFPGSVREALDLLAARPDATVVAGATWGLYVNARDAAGNVSQASTTVSISPAPICDRSSSSVSRPGRLPLSDGIRR